MNCDCKWTNSILALIVIVFSVIVTASWSNWVVFIAGILILVHAFGCKNCTCSTKSAMPMMKKKGKKKK